MVLAGVSEAVLGGLVDGGFAVLGIIVQGLLGSRDESRRQRRAFYDEYLREWGVHVHESEHRERLVATEPVDPNLMLSQLHQRMQLYAPRKVYAAAARAYDDYTGLIEATRAWDLDSSEGQRQFMAHPYHDSLTSLVREMRRDIGLPVA